MLTVQPKFTNYSNNTIDFRAKEIEIDAIKDKKRDDFFQEKVDYYKDQAKEFDKMSKDTNTPTTFRKAMKALRIVSEALLEGWAVAWGASKASKMLKSSAMKSFNSNFGKQVSKTFTSIGGGIKSSAKKFSNLIKNGIKSIDESEFVNSMRKNSVGKYVVKAFEYISEAFKFVGSMIAQGAKKVTKPFKEKPSGEIYDKITKGVSATCGVGAGVASAYSSTIPEDKKNRINNNTNISVEKNSQEDEYEPDLASEVEEIENEDIDLNKELED